MNEDKEWVSQVLQGNKQAYAHLIDKYKNKIYIIMNRMLKQPQDAQDAAQECFIKAYGALQSYDPSRKFSTWLYRIAVNLCIDILRSKQLANHHVDVEQVAVADVKTPETLYLKQELSTELHFLINLLPEAYRIVLLLRYVDDLSFQEMSEILDISINSVQVRLHRAKQKLREQFKSSKAGGGFNEMY